MLHDNLAGSRILIRSGIIRPLDTLRSRCNDQSRDCLDSALSTSMDRDCEPEEVKKNGKFTLIKFDKSRLVPIVSTPLH
ncbi:hypothetical protein PILCRDRAFT_813084 [Piloderma croceum F 1598]|uniref:Uncharacterized protein n=1 Tax=Piloderma croceum (strain F 1598) TaxID=765440 RepID=A0A0C3GBS3_PILCF|nr:hypothetical protein PILCRDRAFT_813084 [Piloderma croceum F 1598]